MGFFNPSYYACKKKYSHVIEMKISGMKFNQNEERRVSKIQAKLRMKRVPACSDRFFVKTRIRLRLSTYKNRNKLKVKPRLNVEAPQEQRYKYKV